MLSIIERQAKRIDLLYIELQGEREIHINEIKSLKSKSKELVKECEDFKKEIKIENDLLKLKLRSTIDDYDRLINLQDKEIIELRYLKRK